MSDDQAKERLTESFICSLTYIDSLPKKPIKAATRSLMSRARLSSTPYLCWGWVSTVRTHQTDRIRLKIEQSGNSPIGSAKEFANRWPNSRPVPCFADSTSYSPMETANEVCKV